MRTTSPEEDNVLKAVFFVNGPVCSGGRLANVE
jgi:hypothetical protein